MGTALKIGLDEYCTKNDGNGVFRMTTIKSPLFLRTMQPSSILMYRAPWNACFSYHGMGWHVGLDSGQ
jgi:hypothetical protein